MLWKREHLMVALALCCAFLIAAGLSGQYKNPSASKASENAFEWPEGKRAAVSLTFDDARLSQIDRGLALLDQAGVKVTFYVQPGGVKERLEGWKKAVAEGYEIGNHSVSHPCSGNLAFSLHNALEDYTLPMMAKQLDDANAEIKRLLGVKPVTFAYPCGQKFVGRGRNVKSYVPLVAERFLVGRGYMDEAANNPAFCDLAQATGVPFDDMSYEEMIKRVSQARAEGRWLIFVGHEIGESAFQTTDASALQALCKYLRDPANGIWVDTVEVIAKYIEQQRKGSNESSRSGRK
jgi:peptidoglycan/xylan/chitin deacetylase (PgdA/CDA1 family)